MLHKQFRGAERGCSRGERIFKKGPEGENVFQVHASGVAQSRSKTGRNVSRQIQPIATFE